MNILMPQLGETVTEGKISAWRAAVGDALERGDILFELETDKTSMDVTATSAGVLTEIRVTAGEVVPVGAVVAILTGEGEVAAPAKAKIAPAETAVPLPPVAAPTPFVVPTPIAAAARALDPFNSVRTPERNFGPAALANGVRSTPLARRLASQAGISLLSLTGSGPHGRIVAADVRSRAESPTAGGGPSVATGMGPAQVRALYADVPHAEVDLNAMRRTIASRLVESKQTVPHFYLLADLDVEALLALRARVNASGAVKLSVNDLVVKAYALALQDVPAANAVWAADRILTFDRVDLGVAVAIEGGLLTPVIRDAGAKGVRALAAEIRDLAERARARKLTPAEYQGGVASISNLGMYGVRQFSAIINPPQSTLLAVGAAGRRPAETADGGIRFTDQMTVTLSCDHRVVDGAVGAELLAAFKAIVEEPIRILL